MKKVKVCHKCGKAYIGWRCNWCYGKSHRTGGGSRSGGRGGSIRDMILLTGLRPPDNPPGPDNRSYWFIASSPKGRSLFGCGSQLGHDGEMIPGGPVAYLDQEAAQAQVEGTGGIVVALSYALAVERCRQWHCPLWFMAADGSLDVFEETVLFSQPSVVGVQKEGGE